MKDSLELRDKGCSYCNSGDINYSYDDSDGMIACIHPATKSQAWWMTVNFRGDQRDFYIEFCPFCGKRLVPFRESDHIGVARN